MPTAPYSYGLYNSDTIRLVHIYPGLWDDPIVCGLQYRSLDASAAQACSYAALSYVWGSAAIREVISLEEVETQVTLNLFCALKYLRKVNESVVLWVDALVSTHLPLPRRHRLVHAYSHPVYQSG